MFLTRRGTVKDFRFLSGLKSISRKKKSHHVSRLSWKNMKKYEFFIMCHEDRDNLEGPLNYEECKNVLESFQNDKSPGEDGFIVEFYKLFYDLPSENLLACLNEANEENEHLAKKGHYYFITKGRRFFTRSAQLEADNPTEC